MYLDIFKAALGINILIGVILLQLWGARFLFRKVASHLAFHRQALSVMGEVIAPATWADHDDDTIFQTRYRYSVDGQDYVGADDVSANWQRHKPGRPVRVFYLRERPDDGRLRHPVRPFVYAVAAALLLLPATIVIGMLFAGH